MEGDETMATIIVGIKLSILIVLAIISIKKEKKKSKCTGNCMGCSGCSDMKNEMMKEYYKSKEKE